MKHRIAAMLLLCVGTANAHDVDWKPYAGLTATQSQFDNWSYGGGPNDGSFNSGATIDEKDVGFGVFAGIEPHDHVGLELGYYDYGEAFSGARSDGSGGVWEAGMVGETMGVTSLDLSLLGRMSFTDAWVIFGRVGVSYYEAEWVFAGTQQPSTPVRYTTIKKHQSPVFGGGVQYRGLEPCSFIVTYQSRALDVPNESDDATLDTISLSAAYRW